MGIIRPRILLSAALDGRATFLVAGAVLGVGVYGFAITFKPYESGRILQPFPVLEPVVMRIEGPIFEPPSVVLPEVATPLQAVAPVAPGETLVSVPRPVTFTAARPQAPSVAAAAGDGAAPLEPVPDPEPESAPAPRALPPVVIAPENVLVYVHPGYGPREDSKAGDDDVEAPGGRTDGDEDDEDSSKRRSQARATSDRDDE